MSAPIERLLTIMSQLRDPQSGCPWDKAQTYDTIAPYTLEETYEVLDAIARADFDDLKGELGDLLFQVVFYAQIAQEEGRFDFSDIVNAVSDKLTRRHPHIFAKEQGISADAAISGWEQRKSKERAEKAQYSLLDDIPVNLPALMRAYKIQKRCATAGFDWDTLAPVLGKVYEELDEVMEEVNQPQVSDERVAEELGDLLFAVVNFSRHLGYKPEMVLHKACRKFEARFRQVETQIAEQGLTMESATLADMEKSWQDVKSRED